MKSPIYGCPGFAAGIWGQSKNTWIKPATSDNVSIFTLTPIIDEIRENRRERVRACVVAAGR